MYRLLQSSCFTRWYTRAVLHTMQAGFSNGGWNAAYGQRQWDGKSTATAAAAVASVLGGPATASAAAAFLQQMIQQQVRSMPGTDA